MLPLSQHWMFGVERWTFLCELEQVQCLRRGINDLAESFA
jgi:hypothetical protein